LNRTLRKLQNLRTIFSRIKTHGSVSPQVIKGRNRRNLWQVRQTLKKGATSTIGILGDKWVIKTKLCFEQLEEAETGEIDGKHFVTSTKHCFRSDLFWL